VPHPLQIDYEEHCMVMKKIAIAFALSMAGSAMAAPVMMSADWGAQACEAWNNDPVLTTKLVESGWIKNDKGRGYKVMQVYRTDCGDKATAEMRIALKDGKATCVYGGKIETAKMESGADYTMHAETTRWKEMGAGEYGPMKAMLFGRLLFSGPYGEAMSNMGPFESFLLLVGKVPADTASCPM
jgi:putative sterol carrier protein